MKLVDCMISTECYDAVLNRDPRYDGIFFYGVITTGVYCRPICSARPKKQNMAFFASALLAQKKGYRPCLRCIPGNSPSRTARLPFSSYTVSLLDNVSNLPLINTEVCRELGWLRALNRNLEADVETATGETLSQIIRNNRLDFARKLVSETNISLEKIANGTGFGTIHYLDKALKNRFDRVSASLRRKKAHKENDTAVELVLYYRPPFDWFACLDYYAKHKIGNLERIKNGVYDRDFIFDGRIEHVKIKNQQEKNRLVVQLSSRGISCIDFVLSNQYYM